MVKLCKLFHFVWPINCKICALWPSFNLSNSLSEPRKEALLKQNQNQKNKNKIKMKFIIVFAALFAVALAAPRPEDTVVLRSESDVGPESFQYS